MLTILNLDNSEQWDNIVKSFKDFDTYYLSGYVKGLKLYGDGEPLLFYFNNEKIRGLNS